MVRNTRETRRPCALTFESQPNGIDVGQGWLNHSTIHFEGMLRNGTSWWNPIIWCFFLCLTCWHIIKQRDDIYIHLPSNLQKINKSLIPAAGQTPRKLKARGCDLPLGLHQWSMAFNGDSWHRDSREALCPFADPWQHFGPLKSARESEIWEVFFFGGCLRCHLGLQAKKVNTKWLTKLEDFTGIFEGLVDGNFKRLLPLTWLRKGCKAVCLFDCCHSATVANLTETMVVPWQQRSYMEICWTTSWVNFNVWGMFEIQCVVGFG